MKKRYNRYIRVGNDSNTLIVSVDTSDTSATYSACHHFNSLPSLLYQVLHHPRQVSGSTLMLFSASKHFTIIFLLCLEEYKLVLKS